MLTLMIVRAFSLMLVTPEGIEVNASAPWVDMPITVKYGDASKLPKARTPWAHEALNKSGTLPEITPKGRI